MERDVTDLHARLLQSLGGSYDFERELGGGGMSRVFLVRERRFDRKVVVKVLAPELAAGVSAERFAREVALAARLQQANIVPMIDAGNVDDLPYYTMPWVEGESLRARLDRRGAASVADTVAIVGDVAKALSYAHAHGVVHRDIKPENILLSGHTAVVTDFGIAKAISASRTLAPFETLTQVGTSLGTPAYMAPEQAMGDPATDHRADLYALGVVAYEMLAGERPFTATTLHELIRAHVTQVAPPLLARRADVPVNLAALITRCLEKNPTHRPPSADAVLEALGRVHDAPRDALHGGRDRSRSEAWLRVAVGTVVVAALAVAGTMVWKRERRAPVVTDPLRVLVAAPTASEQSIAPIAELSGNAVTRILGQIPNLRLAERAASDSSPEAEENSVRRARELGASIVVTSTAYPRGPDSVRVEYRVLDATTGELLRAIRPLQVARTASDAEWATALDPLLSTVALATFPWLGPRAVPVGEPPRYSAARELLAALSLGTRTDSQSRGATILRSQRAWELDTTFVQARLWSAALRSQAVVPAYSGQTRAKMDSVLEYAEPLRDRLTPFETSLLDFVAATRRGEQGNVLAALRRMQAIAPDAILARNLPEVLLNVNRPHEALRLLQSAPRLRDLDGRLIESTDTPVYWTTLADVYHYLGEYAKARDAAARLRQLRPDFVISVRYQISAAAALGDSAAVESLLSDVRTMKRPPGSYHFFGDIALQAGQELIAHGHPAFGKQLVRRALDWFETRPPDERDWRIVLRHAITCYDLGDPRRGLAVLTPFLDQDSTAVLFRGMEGRLLAAAGDTAGARGVDARLAAMGNDIGGSNTLERAFIAAQLGHREQAVSLLQEAFAQGLNFNIRWRLHWFTDTRDLRGYPPFDALVKPQG